MASPTRADSVFKPLTGHCSCAALSYTLAASPLITHCCYCTWCRRESGSAFALNALIESSNFEMHVKPSSPSTSPVLVPGPTPSGGGQTVGRCPVCSDGLFKYYGDNRHVTFVKAGTLDDESFTRVMEGNKVHIFTGTKPEWVDLTAEREKGVGVYENYYDREEVWSADALERRKKMMEKIEEESKKRETMGSQES